MAVAAIESTTKGMIFLETGHPIVAGIIREKTTPGAKPEPINHTMSDFDAVNFNVYIDTADLNTCFVSLHMTALPELMQYGAQVVLDDVYPGLATATPREGYHLTLSFAINALPWVAGKTDDSGFEMSAEDVAAQEDFVGKISQLKRRLMGGPFDQCFAALLAGHAASLPPIQVHYRPLETVFIVPQVDRIVVVYSVDFPDRTDQAISRVFLQEFADVHKRVSGAPPVQFTRDEPLELQGVPGLTRSANFVGYISFAMFSSHVDSDAKRSKAVTLVQGFRNYLHYHIKASKSYLHMRMRSRVVSLLQVLNRAVPDKKTMEEKVAGKKTMSGKTFTRR